MWSGGELRDSEFVADGGGDFLNDEFGVRTNDGGAEELVFRVGEKLDEAVAEVGGVRSGDGGKWKDGFFAFKVFSNTIIFGETGGGDGGESIGDADEAFVVFEVFGLPYCIGSGESALVGGAFSGRFSAEAIAGGVNVLDGGFKEVVGFDAVVGIDDAGVF